MSNQLSRRDPWRWPLLLLWGLFFLIGLWPEFSFYALRSAGYVFSQNAIINSYHFITWCLTGYVAYVAYHRCLDARMPALEALGKSIQLGVVAFVAFVDLPIEHIPEIRNGVDLTLILGIAMIKLLSWTYLFLLFARYHWRQDPKVFVRTLSWLASGVSTEGGREHADTPAEDEAGRQSTMKEQAD